MTVEERRQAIKEELTQRLHLYRLHVRECGMLRVEPSTELYRDLILALFHDNGAVLKVDGVPKWFTFKWVGKQPDEILLDDIVEAGLTNTAPLIEKK
ncbi:hypothetical protein LCGC14_1751870 [marine sediment metagenome]|uniref:Uncharacterized protein n=1 Tax=marine sediment metagenome TaxID=412755 RepID=A0A0F9K309_9ZZZZ